MMVVSATLHHSSSVTSSWRFPTYFSVSIHHDAVGSVFPNTANVLTSQSHPQACSQHISITPQPMPTSIDITLYVHKLHL